MSVDYAYLGYTQHNKIVKGKITAAGEAAATEMLASAGCRVVSLKPVTTFMPDMGSLFKGKVKPSELITFSRQLALLLESGVGIVQSLELLQDQTSNKELKKVLVNMVATLRSGGSLAAALSKHPHVFSNIYSKMVAVGEQTGGLEGVLRSLADYIERQAGAINKLKTALMYPIIVFCLAIVVGAILIFVVLPPIVSMFASLGGELPLPTRILLGSIDFANNYRIFLLILFGGLGLLGFIYSRSKSGRFFKARMMLRLPALGHVVLLSELARCCRNLALLFRAGLPLPEIIRLTGETSGNQVLVQAFVNIEQEMLQGEGLARPMAKNDIFLPLMVEMTRVGEETGNLDATLLTVAETYEVEADDRRRAVLGLIEPTMTIGMGLMVAFIALSIYMPIYGILGAFK